MLELAGEGQPRDVHVPQGPLDEERELPLHGSLSGSAGASAGKNVVGTSTRQHEHETYMVALYVHPGKFGMGSP